MEVVVLAGQPKQLAWTWAQMLMGLDMDLLERRRVQEDLMPTVRRSPMGILLAATSMLITVM